MITIPVASLDACHNFALEYYLMTEKKFTDSIFMLWSTTPTVMLGKYQEVDTEVNLKYAKQHNINVIRRLSGGGTIYTDEGSCQFTLIRPINKKIIDFSNGMQLITSALHQIGFFVTPDSRNDLIDTNKLKVSGNAQYLTNDRCLHHGSLLFEPNQTVMSNVLHADSVKLKAKGILSVRQRTGNLKQQHPSWSPAKFKYHLNTTILNSASQKIYHLNQKDEERIDKIVKEKFPSSIVYTSASQSNYLKKQYFNGAGLVQIRFTLKSNKLTDVHISGDFFSDIDPQKFAKVLEGVSFDPATVYQAINRILLQFPIVGITANELVALMFDEK